MCIETCVEAATLFPMRLFLGPRMDGEILKE